MQDAVVKGIQAAQTGVQKVSAKLQSGSSKASAKRAQIQAEVNKYKSQIDGLAQQLKSASAASDDGAERLTRTAGARAGPPSFTPPSASHSP